MPFESEFADHSRALYWCTVLQWACTMNLWWFELWWWAEFNWSPPRANQWQEKAFISLLLFFFCRFIIVFFFFCGSERQFAACSFVTIEERPPGSSSTGDRLVDVRDLRFNISASEHLHWQQTGLFFVYIYLMYIFFTIWFIFSSLLQTISLWFFTVVLCSVWRCYCGTIVLLL